MNKWPEPEHTIDTILDAARSYALDQHNITHPEDIAAALGVAIDVAWRTIKPTNTKAGAA